MQNNNEYFINYNEYLRNINMELDQELSKKDKKIREIIDITPTEKINGTRLFIFIHSKTMF